MDLPEQIESALESMPTTSRLVLEGGCITAQTTDMLLNRSSDPILEHEANTAYALRTTADCPVLPGEVTRTSEDSDGGIWITIKLAPAETLDVDQLGVLNEFIKISYSPTETQLATLQRMVDIATGLKGRFADVNIAVFYGDLNLSEPLRGNPKLFLPEPYEEALAEFDKPIILSEKACRNLGKRKVFEEIGKIEKRHGSRKIYEQYGFAIMREEGIRTKYLVSDYIIDNLLDMPYAVGITKGSGGKPTCGIILAGRLVQLSRFGFTHIISNYDRNDDIRIHRKNVEGSLIAGYLLPKVDMRTILWTTHTLNNEVRHLVDNFDLTELRQPGDGEYQDIVKKARKRNYHPTINLIDACNEDTCFLPMF